MVDAPTRAWPAPAKINLMLRIVGRRADGYHLLQTVFQFVDLCDALYFQVREDGIIARSGVISGVKPAEDLTVRAAELLRARTGTRLGANIALDKKVPLGAGLGGGSSDAATTLLALNGLWHLGLSRPELEDLGLKLGADVPVFVRGHAAWAEGVGEQLTEIDLPQPWYLLVVPDVRVATARIFGDPKLTRNSRPITIADFLAGVVGNDCEAVVRLRYPAVEEALAQLGKLAPARLTGTGAAVYASFANMAAAETVRSQLPARWGQWVVRGLNRSPLLDRLQGP